MNKFTMLFTITSLLLIGFITLQPEASPLANAPGIKNNFSPLYKLETTSGTVHVAGVVTATDSTVVSAKTNGVLQSLFVTEGSVVNNNQKVATQDTTVQNAEIVYQNALKNKTTAEQAATVDIRRYTAEKASVTAISTEKIAFIQSEAVEMQLQAEAGAVRTAIEAGITIMLDTLAFTHENPSLFSDSKREQFDEIVNNLYGNIPSYFSNPINYGNDFTTTDTIKVLEEMRSLDINSLSILDTETLAVVVMGQLRALVTLYTTAEADILDNDVITQGSNIYNTYFANRTNILTVLSTLESAQKSLQIKTDTINETEASNNQSITITDIDKTLTERQAKFSEEIANSAEQVAIAATSLAVAEASLGTIYAPFSGVVSTVYVEIGEYVTAGQPLFTLHGNEARELKVSVPVAIGTQLQTGDFFYVNNKIAGTIDRLSPVQQGYSIEVFISLSDISLPVGSSLQGELSFATTEDSVLVPREYVFFNSVGPYVLTESENEYPLQIIIDNGDYFVIKFNDDTPTESLTPSRSVVF